MNKFPPVVYKGSSGRLEAASVSGDEVVDPRHVLSRELGQQLTTGPDDGVLLKGAAVKSAFPSKGDLCDLSFDPPGKDSASLSVKYSDLLSGWAADVVSIPMATPTSAGFMSGSDKETLVNVVSLVESMQDKGARLDAHEFSFSEFSTVAADKAAEQLELTQYALGALGVAGIGDLPNNVSVRNLNGNHLFRFNLASPASASYWVDDGLDTIATATTSTLGVVRSVEGVPGSVAVQLDGTMEVTGWAGVELTANKTDALAASNPSSVKYPSERAVSDALAAKESTANKVTALSGSSTDAQYPTAKVVYDSLALKEDKSNKTA